MNLYLLERTDGWDHEQFDAAVVAAETEDLARLMHPDDGRQWGGESDAKWGRDWCASPDLVTAKLIGTAAPGTEPGVVLGSFRAG